MKKLSVFPVVAALVVSSSAFAGSIYSCGQPQDAQGHEIMGGPSYQIEIQDNQDVILEEAPGVLPGHNHEPRVIGKMEKISHEVEFSTYKLGNVSATVGKFFSGIWRDGANITVHENGDDYSANCQ